LPISAVLVLADYRLRKRRDLKIVEWRYNAHIKPSLGNIQAALLKMLRFGLISKGVGRARMRRRSKP
jgi:hypothetical protein